MLLAVGAYRHPTLLLLGDPLPPLLTNLCSLSHATTIRRFCYAAPVVFMGCLPLFERLLRMIDDEHFERSFVRLELQSELFL